MSVRPIQPALQLLPATVGDIRQLGCRECSCCSQHKDTVDWLAVRDPTRGRDVLASSKRKNISPINHKNHIVTTIVVDYKFGWTNHVQLLDRRWRSLRSSLVCFFYSLNARKPVSIGFSSGDENHSQIPPTTPDKPHT